MKVEQRNFVDAQTLHTYNDIDVLKVIEEALLFKGTDAFRETRVIRLTELEDVCLVTYNLKVNQTNKLYVGMHLDKQIHRKDLLKSKGVVKIPKEIFDRVEAVHAKFRVNLP
jgi:hypothetical protein